MSMLPYDRGDGDDDVLALVRRYWGYESLRPLQSDAIRAGVDEHRKNGI